MAVEHTGSSWLIWQKPSAVSRTGFPSHHPSQPKQPPSPSQKTRAVCSSSSTLKWWYLCTVKSSWFSRKIWNLGIQIKSATVSQKHRLFSFGKCKAGQLTCQDHKDKVPCFTAARLQEVAAALMLPPYPQQLTPVQSTDLEAFRKASIRSSTILNPAKFQRLIKSIYPGLSDL